MLRFIRKFLLFLLPLVLALAFFLAFEPYDYFGLRGGTDILYNGRSLTSMRRILRGECKNILLGNSLTANLNEGYIEQVSGIDYDVLAYGGATLNESIEQFWYAAEHCDLERVVIGVSFYTMNDDMFAGERFGELKTKAEDPLAFLSDAGYWDSAVNYFRIKLSRWQAQRQGDPTLEIPVDDPGSLTQNVQPPQERDEYGRRADLVHYSGIINDQCANYNMGRQYLGRLLEIAAYCEDNDIELTFVLYNCHATIWENVIYPRNIDVYIDYYKNALKSVATVYDFEFYNDFAKNDEMFYDGLHVMLQGKKNYVEVIFGGKEFEYVEVTTKEEYLASLTR